MFKSNVISFLNELLGLVMRRRTGLRGLRQWNNFHLVFFLLTL